MTAACGHSACRQNYIDTGDSSCVKHAQQFVALLKAAREVEAWWIGPGDHRKGGAPACIFMLREALTAFPQPIEPLED